MCLYVKHPQAIFLQPWLLGLLLTVGATWLIVHHVRQSSSGACAFASEANHVALASQLRIRGFDRSFDQSKMADFDSKHGFVVEPRRYSDAPWSLPPNAVRAIVMPLDDPHLAYSDAKAVSKLAHAAQAELHEALPIKSRAWRQPPGTLHLTIYHPGLSPQMLGRGASSKGLSSPSAEALAMELKTARRLANGIPSSGVSLAVDRLALTSSGTLLLLLRPNAAPGGSSAACVRSIRSAAASAFPYAATHKQTGGLIHASLLRIVFLPDAERNATAAKAQRIVDRWSARMRGMRLTLKGLVYVKERQIMSLDGEWHRLRFGGAEGGSRRRVKQTTRRSLRSKEEAVYDVVRPARLVDVR